MDDATRRVRFDRERTREHMRAAEELGYTLLIEAIPNVEPGTHAAFAMPLGGDPRDRRLLMHGRSEADAAMNGREALEAIVLHGFALAQPGAGLQSRGHLKSTDGEDGVLGVDRRARPLRGNLARATFANTGPGERLLAFSPVASTRPG